MFGPHRFIRCAVFALAAALPGVPAAGESAAEGGPRVIELYTSHGCSSCPAADELLGELIEAHADAGNLVALEFHVDYWNELVHGGDGNFVDPFSHAAWSGRQRDYARAGLDGRPGVYTPQVVIDGRAAFVGSDARRIDEALAAPAATTPGLSVAVARAGSGDDALSVSVDASDYAMGTDALDVMLVRYAKRTSTEITGGENRHRTAVNHHVVRSMERLGRPEPGATTAFEVAAPEPDEGCAVLLQDRFLTRLHAAALCPD